MPVVDLTREMGTGPFRTRRPVYVDLLPPCNNACPAGENIQAWLALAQAGKYRAAWEMLVRDNPLPAVHGRVCYHPCEQACNRDALDAAVSIHAVERFLGDLATARRLAAADRRAAERQARAGRRRRAERDCPPPITSRVSAIPSRSTRPGPLPGGMMHFGIPAYRLPRADLMKEIGRIEADGRRVRQSQRRGRPGRNNMPDGFDAVFIAIGAHARQPRRHPGARRRQGARRGLLLRDVGAGDAPRLGRRVVVYGGGNTAMDAARTVRRLGATRR